MDAWPDAKSHCSSRRSIRNLFVVGARYFRLLCSLSDCSDVGTVRSPIRIEAVEEMTGRAIITSDESDRTSYTGPYSRHRSESFEYFRLCRSDHRYIGQPSWHVQERALRPFQIQRRD